jgi:hypothetical protein
MMNPVDAGPLKPSSFAENNLVVPVSSEHHAG